MNGTKEMRCVQPNKVGSIPSHGLTFYAKLDPEI